MLEWIGTNVEFTSWTQIVSVILLIRYNYTNFRDISVMFYIIASISIINYIPPGANDKGMK